ncbi:MAG: hydrogenase iron-sulfur subunit [Magnetococcales bacterium]|nr:hydrogenase iron-sulfur subunit [Magnetococcales bacterium]MBF0113640.1 hydrogenase iron-sulfur subunit [Magnetococcales bacterium]
MEMIRRAGNWLFLVMEKQLNAIFGNENNPLYHLGTLSFFFFWVILGSGIYLFVPFETSVAHAYQSVEYMTHQQWWLAGIMRSLHRYASDAVVITIFLHLLREFSRDRYRGVRWFSWFTGIPTLWLVVLLGISGYWLVWDMLAQYVALGTAELVDWLPLIPSSMILNFLDGQVSDRFFTLMAFLHLLGIPIGLVFMTWTHVSRISHVKVMPPRVLAIGSMLALLVLSLLKPAISHEAADLSKAPMTLHIDWFYLNIYPFIDRFGPALGWAFSAGVTLLFLLFPWLPTRKDPPPAQVVLANCNGCGGCARDCPFGAASMQPRSDGRRNTLFESVIDPSLCTACGICLGACTTANPFRLRGETLTVGIDMPGYTLDRMRQETDRALQGLIGERGVLVFGCQRGADLEQLCAADTAVVRLPCAGMIHPSFLDYVLRNGAGGVVVTGCREGDCYFRLGNWLVEERMAGSREPHMHKRVERERILVVWAGSGDEALLQGKVAAFRQERLG